MIVNLAPTYLQSYNTERFSPVPLYVADDRLMWFGHMLDSPALKAISIYY